MIVTTQHNDNTIITLSPNRSATWQQSKWVIIIMVAFVMIIALAWSFAGAWLVLPFAGLEVGLFALLMYKVSLFTYSQQVIKINAHQITIDSGYRKRTQHTVLVRKQIDIHYWETDNNWELPKIVLCNNETRIIIGDFLNLEDRIILKRSLEEAGFFICRNKWWTVKKPRRFQN